MTVNTSLSTPAPLSMCVVIPAYNESAHITACLTSLYEQTRLPDEVIIVDNNCTDDTIALASKFNVTIIEEPRQGIYPAAAAGYTAAYEAGYDLIVRTDIDARFPVDWLSTIETSFIESPEQIALTGPGKFYDGLKLENWLANIFYMSLYFILVGSAIDQRPLFGSNFALRSSVWDEVSSEVHVDEKIIFDDIDLTYHILEKGNITYSKQLYTYISIRPLHSFTGMVRRIPRGLNSIMLHWPEHSPRRIYTKKMKDKLYR